MLTLHLASERVKGVSFVERAWRLFRLGLKERPKAKYCFWFLCWFLFWTSAMALCSAHPLIVGLAVWLPTTLSVIKLADV